MHVQRANRRRLTAATVVSVVAALLVLAGPPVDAAPAEPLRLNDIQVKGSHNSYHIEPPAETLDLYHELAPELEPHLLAYTHPPLTEHLELGFRQFELDLFADREGTMFEPVGTEGFKVLHIDVIDEGSQCPLFTDCLAELEAWSQANPDHVPLAILLEMKEGVIEPTGPTTPADLVALDAEIRSVLDEDQLITPDFVRGEGRPGGADGNGTVYPDVESAILDEGWPLLEDVRGRFIFLLDNERDDYVDGDPTLAGRVAFPPSSPGNPDAAFLKMNDPLGANLAQIQARVAEGYMVRTRADSPVSTGLTGDSAQREAALASGAQWVSGDYLTPTDYERYDATFAARFDLPFDPSRPAYQTVLPGGDPARCNPITAPAGCQSRDVEPGVLPPFFADVQASSPFFDAVQWMADEGITNGFADGTFRPKLDVTREGVAAWLYALAGAPEASDVPVFPDVPASSPFFDAVQWMADEGITNGFADGTFRPKLDITREGTAAWLFQYHQSLL